MSYRPQTLFTSSTRFAIASAENLGVRCYFYSNGTIQERATAGTVGTPTNYDTWVPGANFGGLLNDVDPSSDFAAIGYTSPITKSIIVRVFYQTTNGSIRSVWWNGGWRLDEAIIALGLPGTCISTMQQSNSSGQEGIMVQYVDAEGLLSQRFSTTDAGNWSVAAKVL